ncbi:PREDICTED: uncharacterized protein LOC108970807 isoform X1 [Bactrocera latifrons]|uniref:uncharacterized protein LOC108970807 isoform X1 n=1 Tax=Bactrocera latifrons TaxID=174628 RepID=UPI0008DD2C82|nr:PREDICTED: uncharacterized protein LOC108970807 isoform X1 [Bactrocera latifrons]
MSKMECRDLNKAYLREKVCRLKAVKRDVVEASVRFQILKTVYNCNVHIELLRKYNTYQPFFINRTFDVCEFLRNRKNAVYLDILFKLIEKYTNVNHSCPYEGEFIIERFRPSHNNLILPMPSGDYLIKFGLYTSNVLMAHLYVWFGFKELERWEVGTEGVSPKSLKTNVHA